MKMMTKDFLQNRVQWRSELSFIIVTAGAVIGIGNFWLFPMMIGRFGSGFILVYLFCLLLLGIPAMMAEMLIGRQGRQNQVSTMQALSIEANKTERWKLLGWWGAISLLLILSFYTVISSFSLAYFYQFIVGHFHHITSQDISHRWLLFLSHPKKLLMWNTITIFLSVMIIARGIRHGLETISYITVFGIFILLLSLIGLSIYKHLFFENFSRLFAFYGHALSFYGILSALSYAFFSISIGGGSMLVYASYLPQKASLTRAIFWVVFLELLSSILVCLALNPWLFTHVAASSDGLGLLFDTIPSQLVLLKHGTVDGALFYLIVFLAAWTSIIALMEPLTILLIERFYLSRILSAILVGGMGWLFGIGTILSFNLWHSTFVDFYQVVATLSTEIMLPLGGIGFCIFAGYAMTKESTQLELNSTRYPHLYKSWRFLVRYVTPIGIIIVLIANVFNIV